MKKRKKLHLFDVFVYAVVILLTIIVLYPLLYVISASVSDPYMVASGKVVLFPKGFSLDGYRRVLQDKSILTGYANSLFYTVVGTLINLVVTVPAGYALSKKFLPGRGFLMALFMFTMYFGGGMIPTFLIVRSLGLYDTRTVLLVLGALNVYNCIICRSFFTEASKEIEEAAYIDGASYMRTFITIVLPISRALLGVMVLYFAVAHWNSYFDAMIYTNDRSIQPLQLVLRRILVLEETSADMLAEAAEAAAQKKTELAAMIKYAVIVVSSLPLLIVYPFLQKYFDQGVLIGSVKG